MLRDVPAEDVATLTAVLTGPRQHLPVTSSATLTERSSGETAQRAETVEDTHREVRAGDTKSGFIDVES